MLISAFRRSTSAALARRMFGKVRSFLNRAMTARMSPLARDEEMINVERHVAMEIMALNGLMKGMIFFV